MEEQHKKMKSGALAEEDAVLPEELYFENILTRLQAKDLAICSCVCKLWYKTIYQDSRFASSHYIQNQTNSNLVFSLLNVRRPSPLNPCQYLFKLEYDEDEFLSYRNFTEFGYDYFDAQELVGYCNGLICLKSEIIRRRLSKKSTVSIVNPTRAESLTLCYAIPTYTYEDSWGSRPVLCDYLCHGFGFDSLSQTYKVVILFAPSYEYRFTPATSRSKANLQEEIVCMVLTLGGGTNSSSWRKIVCSTSKDSAPPGSSHSPRPTLTYASIFACKTATLCGGDLYWRITNSNSKNDETEMLLSFGIHNEKFQLIPLPTECNVTPPEHRDLVVGHQLLEFKGYLCLARSELINCHQGNKAPTSGGGSCRCFVKVHLYRLEDKVNQVWNEGETFEVLFEEEEGLQPFCWDLDTTTTIPRPLFDLYHHREYLDTATKTTTKPPPPRTRILSFSDQLLLHWFDGKCVIVYNLHTKDLKVVNCRGEWIENIFESKKKHEIVVSGYRPGDYQLHGQVENILSLKTFLPEGETTKFHSWKEFWKSKIGASYEGWMSTARESVKVCSF